MAAAASPLELAARAIDAQPRPNPRHVIAMVCDFFYPRLGGVEMHIWSLSECLLKMGHKVIVVTNMYDTNAGKRVGVRYMTNGLKVYHMHIVPMVDQATMPTYYATFPLFRKILLREGVTIVHGHAATSPLMHECILQARTMGYRACYTDHSLFGFADAASINVNKYLKFTLSDIDHAICVSHTCRENLVLRANLDPRRVSAIPNAVDASKFTPDPAARPRDDRINIVMLSRLVYRKGIDLVVNVIPAIAARYPNVYFIIGGDGPKKLLLEEMRERHQLHDRVELLGAVPHKNVRDVLTRGHIFLNASLTESFCIAILEAACCGCFVVSTRVGGVPEVLPSRMIRFAEPSSDHLIDALCQAIPLARTIDPLEFHAELREMYNWPEVAARTVRVYDSVAAAPTVPLIERFRRYYGVGKVFGPIAVVLMALLYLIWAALEIVAPAVDVDIVPELPWAAIEAVEDGATVTEKYDALARPGATTAAASAAAKGSASAAAAATAKAASAGSDGATATSAAVAARATGAAAAAADGPATQPAAADSVSASAATAKGRADGRGEKVVRTVSATVLRDGGASPPRSPSGAAAAAAGGGGGGEGFGFGFATPSPLAGATPGSGGAASGRGIGLRIKAAGIDAFGTVKATPMAFDSTVRRGRSSTDPDGEGEGEGEGEGDE